MKKLYTLFLIVFFTITNFSARATMWMVDVGSGGGLTFSPSSFTANVGDVVMFMWASGTHTVETTNVPLGENEFNSGTMDSPEDFYYYTITKSGWHTYHCGVHGGMMSGAFNVVSPTAIPAPATDLLTHVYPNPFNDKVNVKYDGIESIEFYNVLGDKISSVALNTNESKLEVDMESLPEGIYFYNTYKDGAIFETRKIVKAR